MPTPLSAPLPSGALRLSDWGLISAASLMAAVPITIMFVFLQRFFIAQNLAGALKE